jgi:hypothetical protein
VQQDDICFDAECWKTKLDAHIALTIANMEAEGKEVIKISTAWDTKLKDVLPNNKWSEVDKDDDEESNLYGIVVEQGMYTTSYKVGQAVRLYDNRNPIVQEAPRQNIASGSSSSNTVSNEPEAEWDKEFARRVITATWQLDHSHLNENEYNFLLDQVARGMSRLDLEHQIFICRLIGLQLAPEDAKDEIAFYKEQIHANRATGGFWLSVGGTGELLTLLYILELTDDFLDGWTDFQDEEEGHFKDLAVRAQGVDVKAIAEAINTESGETIIAIPESE